MEKNRLIYDIPVDVAAHTVGHIGQSIDRATLATAALEIFHRAFVVHQYRHDLVSLRNHFVERDIPGVVIDIVHNLKVRRTIGR